MIKRSLNITVTVVITVFILMAGQIHAKDGADSTSSFKVFQLILERNIFNPDRRPSRIKHVPVKTTKENTKSAERLDLRGVLINEGGALAFFEGSKPEYNVNLKVGETIIGYQIVEILTNRVTLQKNGRRTDVPIGSSLAGKDGGEWEITSEAIFTGGNDSGNIKQKDKSKTDKTKEGATEDLIKKMMERREREMYQ